MPRAEVNWEGCPSVEAGFTQYIFSHTLDPQLPKDGSLDHILCTRVFERLNKPRWEQLLGDIELSLSPIGAAEIFVAKHDAVMELLNSHDSYKDAILGPNWKTEPNHIGRYEIDDLKKIFVDYGFDLGEYGSPDWEYPCMRFILRRKPMLASWGYIDPKVLSVPRSGHILDIGPGNNPLPQATAFFDVSYSGHRATINATGKPMFTGDIQQRTPFKDKEFDFVFASHILEHLADPVSAAKEMSRIGKAGVVICPSIFKEFMFGWEETDHVWWPMPSREGQQNTIRLMWPNREYQNQLMDKDLSSLMCSVFRAGNMASYVNRKMRKWYRKNEASLDIIVPWENELKVEIYE